MAGAGGLSISESHKVLLLGASGLTGGHCLDLLLNEARVAQLTTLARRPLAKQHAKLVQRPFQQQLSEQQDAFVGVDVVICCLGTTIKKAGSKAAFKQVDFDLCLEAARLAKQQQVARFVIISAVNADANGMGFYARTKGELETALRALDLLQLVIAKPSLLLGERDESRPMETLGQVLLKPLVPVLAKLSPASTPISGQQLARALVAVALQESCPPVLVLRYPELVQLAR